MFSLARIDTRIPPTTAVGRHDESEQEHNAGAEWDVDPREHGDDSLQGVSV